MVGTSLEDTEKAKKNQARPAKSQLGYEWLAEFQDRKAKSRASLNMWFCGTPGIGMETKGDIPSRTEELLSIFLREKGDWDSNLYQSVPIGRICLRAELSTLKDGSDDHIQTRNMALLDERAEGGSEESTKNTCRRNFNEKCLNASELYHALRQKVRQTDDQFSKPNLQLTREAWNAYV